MYFISELKRRNPLLYWYGILNLIAAITCLILWQRTNIQVNGVNAFIKPFKFYISITIFVWTIGWFMHYLEMPSRVRYFNIMAIVVFSFETFVITWQAANGRLSHFNTSSVLYSVLFSVIGIAITVLTIWTGYIGYLFFKKKEWPLPMAYVWGIRLGLLFFVVFAFEGGIMAALLKHTVGGADNSRNGIAVLNWSRQHGDLRIAHFLGMHALQLFPLFGYYITKNSKVIMAFAFTYFMIVTAVLTEALLGLPLI